MGKHLSIALALGWVGLCGPAYSQNTSFSAPSGNIVCYLETLDYSLDGALAPRDQPLICLVFDADWSLPDDYGDDDPTCDLDRTRTVILPPSGPGIKRWTCHGDVFWPLPAPVLSYGSGWSVQSFDCTINRDGVRCVNASGNGIHLRRASVTLS